MLELSLAEARRIALAAQGLHASRAWGAAGSTLLQSVERLGVLQIDAVNVLARAHLMPLFGRHGAYPTTELDVAASNEPRALFEYWGHMASFLPVASQPLFRWRMERAARFEGSYLSLGRFVRRRRAYVDGVLSEIRDRGPLRAGELTSATPRKGGWWGWSDAKKALEWLFWAGFVTTSSRKNFERLYDLPERVLPATVLAAKTPSIEDAHRELLRRSARALGVATEDDLADYFRLRTKEARPRILELEEEGFLDKARVEGISKPHWLVRGTTAPAEVSGRAILSPFDPLVWHRPRAERLFDFHYRIEIYTPEHLRRHGYYVLPFLMGDAIRARVDLKADREASSLVVQASHLEPGSDAGEVASALAVELRALADWLRLERVQLKRKGALAKTLGPILKGRG